MNVRRLAWGVWAIAVAIALAGTVASLMAPRADAAFGVLGALGALGYGTAGALIASRQPRNAVGWLFLWIGTWIALSEFSEGYVALSAARELPLLSLVGWLGTNIGFIGAFGAIPLVLLLFPDGRPPSPRWRPVVAAMAVFPVFGVAGFAISTNQLGGEVVRIPNPTAIPSLDWLASTLLTISGIGSIGTAMLCVVGLVMRYRRSDGIQRRQLRALARVGGLGAAFLLLTFAVDPLGGRIDDVFFILFVAVLTVGVPVACGVAILRHGLYGIDVVINKALVYGSLAAFITAVYVAIVVGLGSLIGSGDEPNLALSIAATALVAVVFQPVRHRVQRVANRLVYGERASPYEVLSGFASSVGGSYDVEDVLPRMARVVAEGTGAARAEVWLAVGGRLVRGASWPADGDPGESVPLPDADGAPTIPGNDRTVAVRAQGQLLGALAVAKPPGETLRPAEASLLEHLASQAGLVVRNARLAADLRARLEDLSRHAEALRVSRQRIVAAEDAERRRLERDIHDGAQQHLVALAVKIRLARQLAGKDPERARTLIADLRRDAAAASDTLAGLAAGIYPPLLSEGGLVRALRAHADGLPFEVRISPDGVGRYPEDVEAAVYFSILEALQNTAKYADASRVDLRLRQAEGTIEFEVIDDGRGFDPDASPRGSGTRNMADRLEALGGVISVDSGPGRGTRVAGMVPATPAEAAA
ncbi:MAG: histidine kinase [Actinomycetota bacterium]